MKTSLRDGGLKRKVGQNTAEYLLMLSIVVVGSIGLLTVFGKTIRAQFAAVTASLTGSTENYNKSRAAASEGSEAATKRGSSEVDASGMLESEFSSKK